MSLMNDPCIGNVSSNCFLVFEKDFIYLFERETETEHEHEEGLVEGQVDSLLGLDSQDP